MSMGLSYVFDHLEVHIPWFGTIALVLMIYPLSLKMYFLKKSNHLHRIDSDALGGVVGFVDSN